VDSGGGNVRMLDNKHGAGRPLGFSLFGGDIIDLSPGQEGHVLMVRQYVPEETLGTHAAQTKDGIGVDDVDSATLRSVSVVSPRATARDYISDGRGRVRIMGLRPPTASGYDRNEMRYMYRGADDDDWRPLSTVVGDDKGFRPVIVDPAKDVAYGLDDQGGRTAAFARTLDGKGTQTLLFAHPQVDVDDFVTIGRNRRAIGVEYVTDKREVAYFDPAMDKLAKALAKALPQAPLVRIVDASDDEQKLLIWAGSDIDPGCYYLLDRATHKMAVIGNVRTPLQDRKMAPVKAVSYAAADGTSIPAYLTQPVGKPAQGLPAIVMPHGGPAARDEWGFDWLAQFFASQGYAVLQPNFRGSSGYGDSWFQKNGFQSWRTAIGDIDDGGRWLVKQGIARADGLAIFGWSYGGYAALQSAVTEPGLFRAVVAVAPVTDLDRLREERRQWSDYARVDRYIGNGPHVDAGSPARHADAIKAPVLLFHGAFDRNVSVRESRLMDTRLKAAGVNSRYVEYPGLDHYLEDADARTDMLTKSAAFLADALKP
jgi:dipeptidyl aminopeptidase/acylaminoacyl peptidase